MNGIKECDWDNLTKLPAFVEKPSGFLRAVARLREMPPNSSCGDECPGNNSSDTTVTCSAESSSHSLQDINRQLWGTSSGNHRTAGSRK